MAKLNNDTPASTAEMNGHDVQSRLKAIGAKYLRIYWHDYTSSAKCRVVPIKKVYAALNASKPFTISITKASLGILPNDCLVPGVNGTGSYTLHPDWSSLKGGPVGGHASCYAYFSEVDGSDSPLCPRGLLRRAVQRASGTGLHFLVGFEIEFTVMERTEDPNEKYRMISHDGHAWSMARALATWGSKGSFSTAADEILTILDECGVEVEQFHAESAPGQFEFVLSPLTPLEACDTLLHTRQVIESAAARHGFRVTLHPRPFGGIGSGCHAHLSISSRNGDTPAVYEKFYGGILEHFRAIFAFTNSHPASYERMVDGLWAGGRWVTWGTQNKETPLRKCLDSHWEIKVLDGLANPYLAMAAIIFAGTEGAAFTWGDCPIDPALLSREERKALGIEKRFPADLPDALQALQNDPMMVMLLGEALVERFVAVKKAEMEIVQPMTAKEARSWIIERY